MSSEREAHIILFLGVWRQSREQLRLQEKTMRVLFDAAKAAHQARPSTLRFHSTLSEEFWEERATFFNASIQATGARDAYASAQVFFIDGLLRNLRHFYNLIPDSPRNFTTQINGMNLFEIFRVGGNNARHYLEWILPENNKADSRAYENARKIAKLLCLEDLRADAVSSMASNYAWPILHVISNGEFSQLIENIRRCLDELLFELPMKKDIFVVAETAKDTNLEEL